MRAFAIFLGTLRAARALWAPSIAGPRSFGGLAPALLPEPRVHRDTADATKRLVA
jgi:hypothetical protein